ncbi:MULTISPECIES: LuxR family transcriptional regulator [unclassified Arthrobacter]|uniref:LuxR family transcriptional regulator n=1 Tax=unclassified Arthrobacter TaxID=235627 RepID=UPI002E0ACFA1|nr:MULTISPECIES: LuxR family transcriptional regulator [unclassified Arthrobacter]MEC5191330.1 hypothetical protein [Arthrobacter sp. MP_M4]MEC5202919.1 hypothetical protein [Arthrobacter sp. MP_M7]
MPMPLKQILATLTLLAALLLPAAAASAVPQGPVASLLSGGATAASATPTESASTPGPVDPGTGETPAAKETRVDYAPYVIIAAVILAAGAAAIAWRRSKASKAKPAAGSDPSK